MAKDRSLVRASDIGSWTFCHRAWWLANIQQISHQNHDAVRRGDMAHHAHSRQVARARQLSHWGFWLVGAALVLLGLALLLWYFTSS